MNEESKRSFETDAIARELEAHGEPLPPWMKYPHIPRYSIGWRMGYGEDYMMLWHRWSRKLDQIGLVAYFKKYAPLPVRWLDWVTDNFGKLGNPRMLSSVDIFGAVHWLEEQGLADFCEFKKWYDDVWGDIEHDKFYGKMIPPSAFREDTDEE
jgi:hypothetical protein